MPNPLRNPNHTPTIEELRVALVEVLDKLDILALLMKEACLDGRPLPTDINRARAKTVWEEFDA